jgi:hypothetical protein
MVFMGGDGGVPARVRSTVVALPVDRHTPPAPVRVCQAAQSTQLVKQARAASLRVCKRWSPATLQP